MSEENVERAKLSYAAFNEAYKTGGLRSVVEEFTHANVVMKPAGILPEGPAEVRGHDELVAFAARQAEAFDDLSMKPERFIDAGDQVVVPLRLGGRARFTGLPVEFSMVHVGTYREGKAERIEVYETLDAALEAAGLSE